MNSRSKGKRGELEARDALNAAFPELDCVRGQQRSGLEQADVVGVWPGTHCEVKRVERLNIHDAVEQAERDAGECIPFVLHRRNRKPWLVTVKLDDLGAFARKLGGNEHGQD